MVKNTLRIEILAYVSEPDKNYNYDGDVVEFRGKRYWVSLAEERVEFLGEIDRTKELSLAGWQWKIERRWLN